MTQKKKKNLIFSWDFSSLLLLLFFFFGNSERSFEKKANSFGIISKKENKIFPPEKKKKKFLSFELAAFHKTTPGVIFLSSPKFKIKLFCILFANFCFSIFFYIQIVVGKFFFKGKIKYEDNRLLKSHELN